MSKKMNEILCCIFATVFLSVVWFSLCYIGASFVEASFSLSYEARRTVAILFGFAFLFIVPLGVCALGPYFAEALEEKWKD